MIETIMRLLVSAGSVVVLVGVAECHEVHSQ